jgi:uncharacterized protein with HEPN domain
MFDKTLVIDGLLDIEEAFWEKIIDMRNFIAHEYFRVDAEDIFDTLQNDVQPLLTTIQQMIADLEK